VLYVPPTSPSFNFPQPPVISSLLGPNILNILFFITLNPCSSLNVRDQVSHPYKITGKIIVLCVSISRFSTRDGKTKDFGVNGNENSQHSCHGLVIAMLKTVDIQA
jgi:hypothetical protein